MKQTRMYVCTLEEFIPLFASLMTPGGVNGNLCRHLAHQTAGGTIECHSCN